MKKENFVKTLQELRKNEKKVNFNQTVDLIVNLKEFDIKRNSIDIVVEVPHKIKEKKVCGFFEKKTELVDTITPESFTGFKDKKKLKNFVKNYAFFMASGKLMPSVATNFGRVLGPQGKMPSPKLGIVMQETESGIKDLIEKINKSIRVKTKEPSIKIAIGREDMKDEEIAENCLGVYDAVLKNLIKGKANVRSVLLKFTMTKPVKVDLA